MTAETERVRRPAPAARRQAPERVSDRAVLGLASMLALIVFVAFGCARPVLPDGLEAPPPSNWAMSSVPLPTAAQGTARRALVASYPPHRQARGDLEAELRSIEQVTQQATIARCERGDGTPFDIEVSPFSVRLTLSNNGDHILRMGAAAMRLYTPQGVSISMPVAYVGPAPASPLEAMVRSVYDEHRRTLSAWNASEEARIASYSFVHGDWEDRYHRVQSQIDACWEDVTLTTRALELCGRRPGYTQWDPDALTDERRQRARQQLQAAYSDARRGIDEAEASCLMTVQEALSTGAARTVVPGTFPGIELMPGEVVAYIVEIPETLPVRQLELVIFDAPIATDPAAGVTRRDHFRWTVELGEPPAARIAAPLPEAADTAPSTASEPTDERPEPERTVSPAFRDLLMRTPDRLTAPERSARDACGEGSDYDCYLLGMFLHLGSQPALGCEYLAAACEAGIGEACEAGTGCEQ